MKLTKIIYVIIITSLFSSCSKLDSFLDKAPASNLSYVESVEDCNMLLNYPELIMAMDQLYVLDDDIEFEDVTQVIGFEKGDVGYNVFTFWPDKFIYKPSEDDPCWNNIYRNIYYTNVILQKIDEVNGSDDVLRNQLKGEAYLFRAHYFFMLVNIYGKQYNPATSATDLGIPLPMDIDVSAVRERGTVQQAYEQIVSDLDNALKYLKIKTQNPSKKTRGSIAGAYGVLAKVYLHMQNWEKAAFNAGKCLELAGELIDYNKFNSFEDYDGDAGQPSQPFYNAENIFVRGGNSMNDFSIAMSIDMSMFMGGVRFTSQMADLIDSNNDLRARLFMGTNISGFKTLTHVRQNDPLYYAVTNVGVSSPEIYLILAEAYARGNDVPGAVKTLGKYLPNRYNKTTFIPYQQTDKKKVLEKIINEKRIEQVYGGHRWFEIRRLFVLGEYKNSLVRKNVEGNIIGTLSLDHSKMVFPIPEKVININPMIKPN